MMHNIMSISTWDCANTHWLHHVLHTRFRRPIDRGGPDHIQTSAAHTKARNVVARVWAPLLYLFLAVISPY
jgi:hypothetical protein